MGDESKAETSRLYENIRFLCTKRRVSFAELERKAGLGNGVLRKWTTASPRLHTVIAVADYFGVTVDELARGHMK